MDVAIFGGGCFWCTEAVFEQLKGVTSVTSGYAGGELVDPTYAQVCSGTTGHAEVIKVTYDPAQVSYEKLLEVFFSAHNPTTRNRQGADIGTQYRSIILFTSEAQRQAAEQCIKNLSTSGQWEAPIVTELKPFTTFYEAEKEHQQFYRQNSSQGYCQLVITPKLKKLEEDFADLLAKKK